MTKNSLLLLKKVNQLGDSVKSSFLDDGFTVHDCQTTEEVSPKLLAGEIRVLVHVLQDFKRDDVGSFHHRLVRTDAGSGLHRIIIYRGDNQRAVSFAADCGMRRSIQGDLSSQSIAGLVKLTINTFEQFNHDVQKALSMTASGDCLFDADECAYVESVCRSYENIPQLRLSMAKIELLRGNLKKALEISRKVLNEDPMNARAMGYLGEILIGFGQVSDAVKALSAAEKVAAGNPLRIALLARLLAESGDRDSALKLLICAVGIVPIPRVLAPIFEKFKLTEEERSKIIASAVA
ncbi:MAG: Tetratricopeptide repeat, partial [Pseudomonadota bacterium]